MAKTQTFDQELRSLQKYIESNENEDAKRQLLYPLFTKLFKDKFSIESGKNTHGADGYVEGQIIIEAKTNYTQWLDGFYQALHYKKKFGLSYNSIMVIAHEFCAIWKIKNLPEFAVVISNTADANMAPSTIGKENARKTAKTNMLLIKEAAQYWLEPKDLKGELFQGKKSLITETYEILKALTHLDSERIQVNKHNFIHAIERMKLFFETPIEAVHAFYSIIPYWDITSSVAENEISETIRIIGFSGKKFSDDIKIIPKYKKEFTKFIETQYVFTNEGSGLTVDYYFSRFDEVLAVIDPEYVKQHGIFFTDDNLSKFALWFAKNEVFESIHENYVVFDPAGGSGNLISSYKGKLKHKIISELQPDLLKIIEKRMKADPWHIETGFTVVPKTSTNQGLNFIEKNGTDYYQILEDAVLDSTKKPLDKPLAFLLNPPYKNTDENVVTREKSDAEYEINAEILALTGADAGKERYLAFLGQILNICKAQTQKLPKAKPLVMIFTPTSWLIPRPTYKPFRKTWDEHFTYLNGFITTSNEFFKLKGKWPLAFTIWQYEPNEERENKVKVLDLTHAKKTDLAFDWLDIDEELNPAVESFVNPFDFVNLDNSRGDIRNMLPELERKGKLVRQPRYDFSLSIKEYNKEIVSGFPSKNKDRHFKLLRKCGESDGSFIGFMDDNTPVRLKQDQSNRMSNEPDSVWFMLMSSFSSINLQQIHSGAANSRSYCAYDVVSSQALFSWYAISKSIFGRNPLWTNQYEIWQPNISDHLKVDWFALCYAFGLAENRCVVTKFEKDNPVEGAPEVWVDNPMSPNNQESFYRTILQKEIKKSTPSPSGRVGLGLDLATTIEAFYQYWNLNYTKGQILENVGLHEEAYFTYFDYPDFVTKDSGLIQIKKYADVNDCSDLLEKITTISEKTKLVKEEIYRMLVEDFKYFE
ncbi:hypothetical protein FB1_11720 [Flavobacterium branchiophilum NBRC 15030 = ATCC 35035]|uniref:Uncharacterized protein n=3 Tax=Flavobacterium branchiophilum TaxID=55197 RepID=A0A543FZQ9_9FLAO|nr:hypothetical protein [Flavobacterium branchiophilum]TQM39322.1 hypothetical protein BC670_0106 [Flavobacterium branchiophilum]GEM54951.1 hypothetical protein FB1_11720 [Flavobacterium branchiophilum NBRC 15030 = ATCC 35035]